MAPQPPSVVWKETLESHPGCTLPGSRDPLQAAEPGSGDLLPNWAWRSDLGGASRNVAGRMLVQREQDSNPGGWRKGRFITLEGQHLDRSKNGTGPVAQGCGVLCLSMWKQASRKDKSRHSS
jgi:hypothetical protein